MRLILFGIVCWLGWLVPCHAAASSPVLPPQLLTEFITDMVQRHDFKQDELEALFGKVRLKQSILDAMERPAEAKPWHEYRKLFIEPKRIAGGVKFWNQHAETLARAEAEHGVPAALIVAIIGVETFYGRNTGSFRVMDALSTLAFAYPKRAPYFKRELEQFLLLAREAEFDPLSIKGSYAGAMGIGQFMPSSYRQYGVDFDGDNHRDLWRNPQDAIGSVANYLHGYGWQRAAPVLAPVEHISEVGRGLANRGWSYRVPVKAWAELGVTSSATEIEAPALLFELVQEGGPEYWLGYENFYVITRYNRSYHYAMAVWQLGQTLAQARAEQQAATAASVSP